jgi:hypothetical protein
VELGEAGARVGGDAADEREEVVEERRYAGLDGLEDGAEVAGGRPGVDAEHGSLHGLLDEVEVRNGKDVWLDGGVGGLYQSPAKDSKKKKKDSDMQVVAIINASHSA